MRSSAQLLESRYHPLYVEVTNENRALASIAVEDFNGNPEQADLWITDGTDHGAKLGTISINWGSNSAKGDIQKVLEVGAGQLCNAAIKENAARRPRLSCCS